MITDHLKRRQQRHAQQRASDGVGTFSANVAGATLTAFALSLIAYDGLLALLAFLFTAGILGLVTYTLLCSHDGMRSSRPTEPQPVCMGSRPRRGS